MSVFFWNSDFLIRISRAVKVVPHTRRAAGRKAGAVGRQGGRAGAGNIFTFYFTAVRFRIRITTNRPIGIASRLKTNRYNGLEVLSLQKFKFYIYVDKENKLRQWDSYELCTVFCFETHCS